MSNNASYKSPSKKRKLNDSENIITERAQLKNHWTRTSPVTGKKGKRYYEKDIEYLKKVKYNREKHIKKKQERLSQLEQELKNDQNKLNQDKKMVDKARKEGRKIALEEKKEILNVKDLSVNENLHQYTKRYVDHVCIVTGAGQGVGQSVAIRLAQEGATVYALDKIRFKDTENLVAEDIGDADHCFGMRVNCTDPKAVQEAVDTIFKKHGYIDVLVNCISYVNKIKGKVEKKYTHNLNVEAIERSLDNNLYSILYIIQEVLPYMLKAEYGRIVTMTSTEALHGAKGYLPFTMAKAAVIGATKTMGKEYADSGVTVNCIAISLLDYQNKKLLSEQDKQRHAFFEEISGLSAFVTSEENTYTTGFCYQLSREF